MRSAISQRAKLAVVQHVTGSKFGRIAGREADAFEDRVGDDFPVLFGRDRTHGCRLSIIDQHFPKQVYVADEIEDGSDHVASGYSFRWNWLRLHPHSPTACTFRSSSISEGVAE